MGSIGLRDVGVFTPTALFRNLTMVVGETDRVGLIAGNGGGKSTLLRCLAGHAEPGAGEIVRSRGLAIGIVEQDVPPQLLDLTMAELVRRSLPAADRDGEAWRVGLALDEFDAPEAMRDQTLRTLSGGWQRLALIARAWVSSPDALLLDEPFNHLDLEKLALLEAWIVDPARRIPMVIASHDRRFLDACTTRTLFLRPDVSRYYAHPYSKSRRLLTDDDAALAARNARDLHEADRLRRSAGALRNIGINSGSDASQKKSAQIFKRADALERTVRATHVERSGDIRLANRGTHARVMIALDDVTISTPDGRALFRTGKINVLQRDRIVVLGRNGVGKSMLVALLRRAMTEPGGVAGVRVTPSVAMG